MRSQLRTLPRWLWLVALFWLALGLLVSLTLEQRMLRPRGQRVTLEMRVAENGGFTPASLRARAGQPLLLHFQSSDVAHGLAIGPGLGIDLGIIPAGESRSIALTIDEPGVYTFYCNLWCSPEHWRMRGVIEVVDDDNRIPPAPPDPAIAGLTAAGVDIDASHAMEHAELAALAPTPLPAPDPAALAALTMPPVVDSPEWQRTHALADALAAWEAANPAQPAATVAGATVAWWTQQRQPADLARTVDLYAKNCAACHGAQGEGNGPAAAYAPSAPVAFTENALFPMRNDVLYAKIRRGGMGTGMPNFGTLFTPQETWNLVDYLWVLANEENLR
ncbi:MAG: c-type cytochrome [Caldilineaceae bacterium]|nr:c-type cytochrome [Caldilineaceae bacterium]